MCAKEKRDEKSVGMVFHDMMSYKTIFGSALKYRDAQSSFFLFLFCSFVIVMSFPDPCRTVGCNAPYNTGCKVRGNKAECICPTCRLMRRPVCASDGVQDLSECHLRQQACLAEINVGIAKRGRCGKCMILRD